MDCADGGSGLFRLVLCGDCAPGSAGVSSRVFCPVGTSCVCGASLIVDSFFSASSCPLTSSHTTHQLLEQEFAGSGSGSGEGALLLPLDHVRPRVERFSRVVNEVMRTPSQQLFRFVLGSRPWSLRERERERERERACLPCSMRIRAECVPPKEQLKRNQQQKNVASHRGGPHCPPFDKMPRSDPLEPFNQQTVFKVLLHRPLDKKAKKYVKKVFPF